MCSCFIADNATARGDAILESADGVRTQVTIWGENAHLLHEGLKERRVCIGPMEIVSVADYNPT